MYVRPLHNGQFNAVIEGSPKSSLKTGLDVQKDGVRKMPLKKRQKKPTQTFALKPAGTLENHLNLSRNCAEKPPTVDVAA